MLASAGDFVSPGTPIMMPEGVEVHWVNEYTSTVTDGSCQNSVLLPFISGTHPAQYRSCKKNDSDKKSWFQSLFGR